MPRRGNPDKLIPQNRRTKEEQSRIGKMGGEKSGKVRREKKLMSAILADYLARQNGFDTFDQYIDNVLKRGDGATVAMIKTFVDSIEGQKIKTESTITVNTEDPATKAVIEKYGIKSKN